MYKCKECGAEYDIKPDYCDCGNDEFEIAGADNNNTYSETRTVDIDNVCTEYKPAEEQPYQPKVQPAPKAVSYNKIVPEKPTVDSVSLAVFIFCILLSLYIAFFAWNPKEDIVTPSDSKNNEAAALKKMPSIDKIWNSTPPKPQPKTEEVQKSVEKIINQVLPKVQTQKSQQPDIQKQQQQVQPKVTVVPLKKVTQAAKPKAAAQTAQKSSVANTAKTSAQNQQEQQKKAAEAQAKLKAEQERAAAEAEQIKKLQAEQARKKAELKAKQDAANKQELATYKANLRNAIGRKIDFTRVIGDGSCTVAFKIDQNGKLINRSFAKQSTNNTLNDAVYNAVMSTPVFNPPPAGYKNEQLNLNIRFYNGNFEISLP